jgi:hypothetical protein
MEVHIKALLELAFSTKPPNFGAEPHLSCTYRENGTWSGPSTRRETSGRYLVPPCSDARAQAQPLPFPSPLSLSLSL